MSLPTAAAAGGLLLSACSNSGLALARQACTHVQRSITEYERAVASSTASAAQSQVQAASRQLQLALPLAAAATSADGRWNPLMTTLQESGRVRESEVVGALRAQCAAAAHPTQGGSPYPTPSTTSTTTTRPSH